MQITVVRSGWKSLACAGFALVAVSTGASPQVAAPALPFGVGEALSYRAVSSRFGSFGSGTLRVDGPEEMHGLEAYRLSFDFRGRVGPFHVEDRSRSWLSAHAMASLRYEKEERSPLGRRTEDVHVFPRERRWTSASGAGGETPTSDPLDELSFLYFVRALPLADGDSYELTRHFDARRNPVRLRVLRRELTRVPAGEFATVVVEMRVQDSRLRSANGAIVLHLTDDSRRIPVRIESSAPWVGQTRLLLESATVGRTAGR